MGRRQSTPFVRSSAGSDNDLPADSDDPDLSRRLREASLRAAGLRNNLSDDDESDEALTSDGSDSSAAFDQDTMDFYIGKYNTLHCEHCVGTGPSNLPCACAHGCPIPRWCNCRRSCKEPNLMSRRELYEKILDTATPDPNPGFPDL